MALVHVPPVEAHVEWDRSTDQPRLVRWGEDRRRVIGLDSIRDERAAYPADRGPRLTLVLRTEDGGRAAIAYDGRRWVLDALETAA